MAWRDRILRLAIGLGIGLAPGCTLTQGRGSGSLEREVIKPDPDPPTATPPANPYHPQQPTPKLGPPQLDPGLKQINYSGPPDDPDAVQVPTVGNLEPTKPPQLHATPERHAFVGPPPPPEKPDEPLVAAVRAFLAKRPEVARQFIAEYDEANQEMLIRLLPVLAQLTEGSLAQAKPEEITTWVEQFDALSGTLRPRAALAIEKMRFCRLIKRYGVYEPFADEHAFRAGQNGQAGEWVQLYVEVVNFSSRPLERVFETQLTCRAEIRDQQGELEWMQDLQRDPDRSQSPRHDYFMNCNFRVPPHIRAGEHVLVIEIRDVTAHAGKDVPAHRIARRKIPFRVTEGDARSVHGSTLQVGGRGP
jgi:hypothetical protein